MTSNNPCIRCIGITGNGEDCCIDVYLILNPDECHLFEKYSGFYSLKKEEGGIFYTNEGCPYLGKEYQCTVHEKKPLYCKFYPIFIKVRKKDKKLFEFCCRRLNLGINKGKGIFYKVFYLDDFEVDYCGDIPLESLTETIAFMEKNIYNFEPALEMIKEMYKKRIKVRSSFVQIVQSV